MGNKYSFAKVDTPRLAINNAGTHDRALYRRRHEIENKFGKLKDRSRIHTRYDRCAHTFMSAMTIAAIVSSGFQQ